MIQLFGGRAGHRTFHLKNRRNKETMTQITRTELSNLSRPVDAKESIAAALNAAKSGGPLALIAFFNHYASWNGNFAGCMTRLSADVSEAKTVFLDPDSAFLRDRANVVASHIFDTVRDEFDDSGTPYRDTHRTLAQAMILGLIQYYGLTDTQALTTALAPKPSIEFVLRELKDGFSPNVPMGIFEGIGFHLGSEFFGDIEYTMIDAWLHDNLPELQTYLKNTSVEINGVSHKCYAWIYIHSGGEECKGVEADHFEMAMSGANTALHFSVLDKDLCRSHILYGAQKFAEQQTQFFKTVEASASDIAALQTQSDQYKQTRLAA